MAPNHVCTILSCENRCNTLDEHFITRTADGSYDSYPRSECKSTCTLYQTQFNTWFNSNRDITWTESLDVCPCEIKKNSNGKWTKKDGFQYPNRFPIRCGYHKGADICMRGNSNAEGRSTQCCYAVRGNTGYLITSGSGQGTADFGPPGVIGGTIGLHNQSDMRPANWAWFLDGNSWGCYSEAYVTLRPNIKGTCPDNPTPPKR
jgi:hypothetical protein